MSDDPVEMKTELEDSVLMSIDSSMVIVQGVDLDRLGTSGPDTSAGTEGTGPGQSGPAEPGTVAKGQATPYHALCDGPAHEPDLGGPGAVQPGGAWIGPAQTAWNHARGDADTHEAAWGHTDSCIVVVEIGGVLTGPVSQI